MVYAQTTRALHIKAFGAPRTFFKPWKYVKFLTTRTVLLGFAPCECRVGEVGDEG
jgi:hypothetical protein